MEAENTKVIVVAYEYTYKDHEYIIRTMNTKHERCGMAFLLQAAHKIAVSCPKTFIVSCLGNEIVLVHCIEALQGEMAVF